MVTLAGSSLMDVIHDTLPSLRAASSSDCGSASSCSSVASLGVTGLAGSLATPMLGGMEPAPAGLAAEVDGLAVEAAPPQAASSVREASPAALARNWRRVVVIA